MAAKENPFTLVLAVALCLIILWCGPTSPAKGTPAFYWAAAKQAFAAGDYDKTNDQLEQLSKTENEYTAQAAPWRLVLLSGMARGYMEMADSFEAGAKANKARPAPFRKSARDYQSFARQFAFQYAETFDRFLKSNKDQENRITFPYPPGNPSPVSLLTKISSGVLPRTEEVEPAQAAVLKRAVLLNTARAIGAKEDTAKAQQMFKSGEVKVPRPTFLLASTTSLYEQALLFGPTQMDDTDTLKIFCARAAEALKAIPESEETKDLAAKIQKALTQKRPGLRAKPE